MPTPPTPTIHTTPPTPTTLRIKAFDKETTETFAKNGYLVLDEVVPLSFVNQLNERLERVLRGEYDKGNPPDKRPKLIKKRNKGLLGFSGNPRKRTLQIINIWKCDLAFEKLVKSEVLGNAVATLGRRMNPRAWHLGARVAQDQIWAKPPGASPLVFHRDSPYFDFDPEDVITVWIALDDMRDEELGPLEYVHGSHLWTSKKGRQGSANLFFQEQRRHLLDDAARREGLDPSELIISKVSVRPGGCGIHDGRCWHGSGPNKSKTCPRRGIGIHFVPACVKWKSNVGNLWKRFKSKKNDDECVSNVLFPVTSSTTTTTTSSSTRLLIVSGIVITNIISILYTKLLVRQ